MGCDYYIYVYLEIEHTHGTSYYEFPVVRGYYPNLDYITYDSDDEEDSDEFQKLYEDTIRLCLTPRKSVVIYDNNSFITPKFETKYLHAIQSKMDGRYVQEHPQHVDTGTFSEMNEILKITKKEIRYER